MEEYSYLEPVMKLLRYGDPRNKAEWPRYLEKGLTEEHIPDLLQMLADENLGRADSDGSEVWAPLHAWRALGQLHAVEAIPVLLKQLHRIDDDHEDWIGEEFPEVFAMIGPSALPDLASYLADGRNGLYARVCAARSLENIGKTSPDDRSRCVESLCRQLKQYRHNDTALNAFLICNLGELKAVETLDTIRQAYCDDCVDHSIPGDLEDVEIYFGVRERRSTKRPNYQWVFKDDDTGSSMPRKRAEQKIGRNHPCPCGSGKKYKKCCLNT